MDEPFMSAVAVSTKIFFSEVTLKKLRTFNLYKWNEYTSCLVLIQICMKYIESFNQNLNKNIMNAKVSHKINVFYRFRFRILWYALTFVSWRYG